MTDMRATLLAAMLTIGAALPSALSAGTSTASILPMLSAYESMPSRDEWLALGNDAVPVLVAIAADEKEASFRRARALTVLGYFSDPRAHRALSTVAGDPTAPGTLRRAALLAFTKQDVVRALPILEQALAAADPRMRQAAVKSLAESASVDARQMLERHQRREREPFLIEAVESALRASPPRARP